MKENIIKQITMKNIIKKKSAMILQLMMIFALLSIAMLCITPVSAELTNELSISVSLVNQDPDPAASGDIVEVRLGIANTGYSDANNLKIEVSSEYPFKLLSEENSVQEIGTLFSTQGHFDTTNLKIIKYKFIVDRNAPAGDYDLKVKYYLDDSSIKNEKTLSIAVKSKESAEIIHIDKTVLIPGKQSSLLFRINNVGSSPLKDLTFNWENEGNIILPVGSDNTRYVKFIDIGGSAEMDYQVIADTNAVPGLYKLNLYLSYAQTGNKTPEKIATIAGVYVGGGTDFDVAFSDSATGQTSFSIANIGSNPANSVSISIPDQKAWRVTGSNSVIVGNLNKGDYTVASFKLQSAYVNANGLNKSSQSKKSAAQPQDAAQKQDLNSSNELIMEIAYTDTLGQRNIVEKIIKLQPQNVNTDTAAGLAAQKALQNQSIFSKYKWYFIGFVILIIGFVVYKKYKKKKLKN